jgi:hypothetical protein
VLTWQLESFITHEEERFVLPVVEAWEGDGTAQIGTEIIHLNRRHGRAKRVAGVHNGVLKVSKAPPCKVFVPLLEIVVISATPPNSAELLISLTRISAMASNDGKSSVRGASLLTVIVLMPSTEVESWLGLVPATERFPLPWSCTPDSVTNVDMGLVVPNARAKRWRRQIDQFATTLSLGDIGNVSRDGGLGCGGYLNTLGLGRYKKRSIHAHSLAVNSKSLSRRLHALVSATREENCRTRGRKVA